MLILDLVVEETDKVAQAFLGNLVEGAVARGSAGDGLDEGKVFDAPGETKVAGDGSDDAAAQSLDVGALGALIQLGSQRGADIYEVVRFHVLAGGAAVGGEQRFPFFGGEVQVRAEGVVLLDGGGREVVHLLCSFSFHCGSVVMGCFLFRWSRSLGSVVVVPQ